MTILLWGVLVKLLSIVIIGLFFSLSVHAFEPGTCDILKDGKGMPVLDSEGNAILNEGSDDCNNDQGYFPEIEDLTCECLKLNE